MKTPKIPKTPGRDEFRAEMDKIVEAGLPRNYTDRALALNESLDPHLIRMAKARRTVYWECLPALRIVAGLAPRPKMVA